MESDLANFQPYELDTEPLRAWFRREFIDKGLAKMDLGLSPDTIRALKGDKKLSVRTYSWLFRKLSTAHAKLDKVGAGGWPGAWRRGGWRV
jgi:hypothetical protein